MAKILIADDALVRISYQRYGGTVHTNPVVPMRRLRTTSPDGRRRCTSRRGRGAQLRDALREWGWE